MLWELMLAIVINMGYNAPIWFFDLILTYDQAIKEKLFLAFVRRDTSGGCRIGMGEFKL